MFSELVESCANKKSTNKSWTVMASGAVEFVVLSLLMLAPLIYTQALPKALLSSMILAPTAPARVVRGEPARRLPQPRRLATQQITAPRSIPRTVATVVDEVAGAPPELPDSSPGTIFDKIPGDNPLPAAKPPAPAAPEVKTTPRIRQGGTVQQAMLISQAKPIYPPLAIQAHIQGDVILHAIIDREGRVSELQVINGHPLLMQSALAAVRQWRYRPTLLNGDPVEVDTTITVSFRMGG